MISKYEYFMGEHLSSHCGLPHKNFHVSNSPELEKLENCPSSAFIHVIERLLSYLQSVTPESYYLNSLFYLGLV